MFINTTPPSRRTCILKRPHLLAHELDEFEGIMCSSMVNKYFARHEAFKDIFLSKYVACYALGSRKVKIWEKTT